jgi:hypothetical protein
MTEADESARRRTRDAFAAALLVALVLAVPLIAGGPRAIASAFQDDAFYYARIARNIARGEGITFDGIHATSGFHPLWLAAIVPAFWLCRGAVAPLVAVAVLQILLAATAAGLITATLSRIVDRYAALAGGVVLVAIPATGASLMGGLEGALTVAAVAASWWLWLDVATRRLVPPSAWIAPGLAFALAGLSRLEAFVLVPVALACSVRRMERPVASITALCAPAAVAAAVVVAGSRALTSTWLPISAAVKAEAHAGRMVGRTVPAAVGGFVAVVAACAVVAAFRRPKTDTVTPALVLPGAAAALWIAADLVSVGKLEPWNRVPVLLVAIVGTVAVSTRWRAGPVLAAVALFALVRVPVRIVRDAATGAPYAPYRWEAGVWLRDHLDPEARVGSWNGGTLGYVSDRHVVNLDGLVNDRAYLDEVIRGRDLAGYLRRERISFIADQACGLSPTLQPYLVRTGSTAVSERAELVASFYDRAAPDGCPGVAIWRLRSD